MRLEGHQVICFQLFGGLCLGDGSFIPILRECIAFPVRMVAVNGGKASKQLQGPGKCRQACAARRVSAMNSTGPGR